MLADPSFRLDPANASALAEKTARLAGAADELSRFSESNPSLAAMCGIEAPALEARLILSGGACARLSAAARAVREGRAAEVRLSDVSSLSRLETVVELGETRIGEQIAAIDAAQNASVFDKAGSFIGLATGIVGLAKSIF